MKRLLLYSIIIFSILFGQNSQSADLTTSSPMGSLLSTDEYGVVTDFTVGTAAGHTPIMWREYATSFLAFNNGVPLEVSGVNAVIWDGVNPPPPGFNLGFFIPARFEDYSFDGAPDNEWHTIIRYEDEGNNIDVVGGIGYKLEDPGPNLGAGYVEWTPAFQFTNVSSDPVTIKPFRYHRTTNINTHATIYTNNNPTGYQVWDFDNIDGTSDDAVLEIKWVDAEMRYGNAFSGFPMTHYRIQEYAVGNTLYDNITNGGAGYNLTTLTVPVLYQQSEYAFQSEEVTLEPGQAALYWLYPKVILVNNSSMLFPMNILWDVKEISSTEFNTDQVFESGWEVDGVWYHNVSINYSSMNYAVNGAGTASTEARVTVARIVDGWIQSGLDSTLEHVWSDYYWEIFYDTRRTASTASITFTHYMDNPDDIPLTIAFRSDYGDDWTAWANVEYNEVDNTLTANDVDVGDGHWALAVKRVSAEFSADPTEGDVPLEVTFTDESEEGVSAIVLWDWDFGDGGISADQNPVYTYEDVGVYTVSLTVTDENGLSDTETKEDYITVSATGFTWHVSTAGSDDTGDGSEGNPFVTIQAGIDAASDGDTVLVADGTYTGTGNKELTWIGLENHIVVMSANGPDNCIIDLEDSGRAFTFISGIVDPIWITADDVIEGFTIRNGHPPNWGDGGAIYCYYGYLNDVSPTIRNCVFENNTADLGGVLYVSGGSSLVEDCVFENNTALNGGVVWTGNAGGSTNLVFMNCTFKNNSATSNGGGAFTISNIYPEGTDASPGFKIENCIFDGNSGPYGGAIYFYTSTLVVERCLFINNSALTNGSALYVYNYGGPVIKNCTIADNTGPEAVYSYGFNGTVEPVFVNTIIGDENSAFGFENTDQANPIISYCDIQGGFPITGTDGGGNIDADPLFVDPDNGDFTLQPTSPCIDAGDPESPLDPDGTIADMGAYYYYQSCDEETEVELWGECYNIEETTELNLGGTGLTGDIPPEIGELVNLEDLWLYNNQLSGEIPSEIGNLTNLTYLNLSSNQLTGEIPSEIGNLTNLYRLWLHYNQLTGEIPSEIGNLTNLYRLWLNANQLTGSIPPEIGNLTNLINLNLSHNQLTSLDVSNNLLLVKLYAQGNQLTTMDVTNNDSLELLHLHENSLTSVSGISNKVNLEELQLHRNDLDSVDISGCVSLESPVNLYNNDLTSIDLTGNVSMTHLNAKDNELTSIDLSTNDFLEEIHLFDNSLTSIDVSDKPNLVELRVYSNSITSIDVSNSSELAILRCESNELVYLNMKNGVTDGLTSFNATNNDSLGCIETLDPTYATENWTYENGNIDEGVVFNDSCEEEFDNEMTVIAGQVSHNGAFLYTFSDPIKHNINLEINQDPVQGVMENNYNGPLGGFGFFHPTDPGTSAEIDFSGDIDFSQILELPTGTGITSHSDGDGYNENEDLTITYESSNYTYFQVQYYIDTNDGSGSDQSYTTTDTEFTIPSEELIGSYAVDLQISAVSGPLPGEELAIVDGDVLSFLVGADNAGIYLQNSSRGNSDIIHPRKHNTFFDWKFLLSGSIVSIPYGNINGRDIAETDVFIYGILANDEDYKDAWVLICSQSYPDDAAVFMNGVPFEDGGSFFPGIRVFGYGESGAWEPGETNTLEITAHGNTTATDVTAPGSTTILNWSDGDVYDGGNDFFLEWSPSDFADFYSVQIRSDSEEDGPEEKLIFFTSETSISVDSGSLSQMNGEVSVYVFPFAGASPEYEPDGNIDGQYGFIWGQGERSEIEMSFQQEDDFPECLTDCDGFEEWIDNSPGDNGTDFCIWLIDTIIPSGCGDDCQDDLEVMEVLDTFPPICEECLAAGDCDEVVSDIWYDDGGDDNFLSFEGIADMNYERYGAAYTTDGEFVYAICGADTTTFHTHGERYNPDTDTWEIFAEDLIPRRYTNAEYFNGNIYLFNGNTSTNIVEIINVSTGEVSHSETNPYPVVYGGSAVWDGNIYLFGGSNSDGYSNRLYEFDPANESWTQLADMPESKQTSGRVVDGILYTIGGYNGDVSTKIHAYDIAQNSWNTDLADMPVGISAHSTVTNGEEIVAIGDYSDIEFSGLYDPAEDSFMVLDNNMEGRRHSASVYLNGSIYAFGGSQPQGYNGNTEYVVLRSAERADISGGSNCSGCNPGAAWFSNDVECTQWVTDINECNAGDLQVLEEFIAQNGINEETSMTDYDNGDGTFEALEMGEQYWVDGRLTKFNPFGNWNNDPPEFSYGLTVVPENIGDLNELKYIDLDNNQLETLPESFGDLSLLETLWLGSNPLEVIPESIFDLVSLNLLGVYETNISEIPSDISNLTNLTYLNLSHNQLTGLIPSEIFNLTNLERLYLWDNQLSGEIPPEIGNLTNLERLYLNYNQLIGSIPPEIGNLTNLTSLGLDDNQLTSSIPPEIGNLANLERLYLNNNQLTGEIPLEIWNLMNLQELGLDGNQLTGGIPPEIGDMMNLQALGLSWNQLSGEIPSEIGNLTSLWGIWLDGNQLTGEIPQSFCDIYPNLTEINLGDNNLCPPYPECLLGEEFIDSNGNGVYDEGEEFVDSNENGIYDDPVGEQDTSNCGEGSITVDYQSGWNMVGLPLEVEDAYYQTLFPDAFNNAMYSFNGSYSPVEYLVPGTGYLIRLSDGGTVEFSGTTIDELTIPLTEGWNLISGISTSLSVDVLYNSGLVVSNGIYAFDGSYYNAETIDPGMGYWVRALADGEITLSSTALATKTVEQVNHLEGSNTLELSNGTHSSTLYFGKDVADEHKDSYSLPPSFPQMAFDVRFNGDMKYAVESGEIEVLNTSDNLTISYDVVLDAGEHMNWVLTAESGEEYTLEGTGEITVPTEEIFTLERKAIIPIAYTLHQNYPNPFNPITSIRYDLPEAALVTLTIYDLIGREITQLVNTTQEAGYRSVRWDATDSFGKPVSAGVYLYQIRSGGFVQTKKMVLLK